MQQPVATGFVLAGGRSSRMGRDKALVEFRGQPLVAHAVSLLRGAGLTAAIAGARSPLAEFAPIVEDPQPNLGPLSGICAALASTSADSAVFVPVDLPLLPVSLIAFLVRHARTTGAAVTLCSVDGIAQTFPVVLRRELLPVLKIELEAGRGGCFSAFHVAAASPGQSMSLLPVEELIQSGQVIHPGRLPAIQWFMNVNNPEDLERAESILPSPSAT